MIDGHTIVVDAGKTNAKVSLWDGRGGQVARRSRANQAPAAARYASLDVAGIDAFVIESLAEFAAMADVRRIIPVGHGAAAALLRDGGLYAPPMDYEESATDAERDAYSAERDSFAESGSPFLPAGLNLGMQLHRLEAILGPFPEELTLVPWAQYWAWRLSGVAATEVSSLGSHTDLWLPLQNRYSALAERRGWAQRMAPLRKAGAVLAPITPEVAAATGLPRNCAVHCGLHDSNAALLAARGHREIRDAEATVLSTGTWFVAMRSPGPGKRSGPPALEEARDCLINVDVHGSAVPSARFMGGRESELISGIDSFALTDNYDAAAILDRIPGLVTGGAYVLPTFAPGVGPYPGSGGAWINEPADADGRRAATGLYLALMADTALELIGSRDRLLIEGRFAEAEAFVRVLATLRPQQRIHVSNAHNDVAYGALRLIDPELESPSALTAVMPLDTDLGAYAKEWRAQVQQRHAES